MCGVKCKTAVVTGASSGIGRAITVRLLKEGFKVYGIGRNFEFQKGTVKGEAYRAAAGNCDTEEFRAAGAETAFLDLCTASGQLVPLVFDMLHTGKFYEQMRLLSKKEAIGCLVNNAGVAYYGPHETLNPSKIHEMVTINIEVPMTLCQLFMRNLKASGGHIVNISSLTAKQPSPHGCAYAATKSALTGFSSSLFEEVRKYGVRVTAIHPEMTKTNLYRNADFCEGETDDTYLTAAQVADSVMYALAAPPTMDVADITLVPQRRQIRRR